MHNVELLVPAGNLEQLKLAINYGADSVYIGGEGFGMRSLNFTTEEIEEGIKFAHERGKKVYVTVNVIPHNEDFIKFDEHLLELEKLGVDAVIISDPGILTVVKRVIPNMEIHLGDQANITNYVTANFWYNQGVKKVTVAKELSCKEISGIRSKTPLDMDIEAFIHGPMCISYSGRCLISNYMAGKGVKEIATDELYSGNYRLIEDKRPDEYYPVQEDERGTFFFNSKDLCMIEYIPELIKSGITSFKIEGKMKESYYVASVTRAYRMAIDAFYENPLDWKFNPLWLEELKKGCHRDFTTGFYLDETVEYSKDDEIISNNLSYEFIGRVKKIEEDDELALIKLENPIKIGDEVEVIGPYKETINTKVEALYKEDGEPIDFISDSHQIVKVKLSTKVNEDYMLRRKIQDEK